MNKMNVGRHQFIARKKGSVYGNSENKAIIGGWHVEAGELCKVSVSSKREVSVCVIGNTIDSHGELENENDTASFLSGAKNINRIAKRTSRLGGYWVLLIDIKGKVLAMNDCCGLLPIYYHKKKENKIIGSSISKIAKHVNENKSKLFNSIKDPEDFFSAERLMRGEYSGNKKLKDSSLPLGVTPYSSIKKLLPNRIIRLDSFESDRVFPVKSIRSNDVKSASNDIIIKMTNIIRHIGEKFGNVRLPLTSGMDSRVLFAICEKSNIKYRSFTYVLEGVEKNKGSAESEFGRDALVAKNICRRYGVEHDTIEMKTDIDVKDVTSMLNNIDYLVSSSTLPYEFKSLKEYLPKESTVLNGSVSEIGRPLYGFGCLPDFSMHASLLANISGHQSIASIRSMFDEWIKESKDVSAEYGIGVMDLLYWEERMGNWQSSFQQQLRPITNVITPYNCRSVIRDFLSVSYKKRVANKVHKNILSIFDPNLLSYPINPPYGNDYLDSSKYRIKKAIKKKSREKCFLNLVWWILSILKNRY